MAVDLSVEKRASRIKLLLMDCDGVLTDGRITLFGDADEYKSFHTRDGQGLSLLHSAGVRTGIISGRSSQAVRRRVSELGMAYLFEGIGDKTSVLEDLLAENGIAESEYAYIGDDLTDIPLMIRAGLAVAVADATDEVKHAAHFVTALNGGFGAVREVCELILKSQGQWQRLIDRYGI
jgi:3-deoxy-D-manno-octulosonate 8-phosphate phosphatase (KDO 8-P phosphatase)